MNIQKVSNSTWTYYLIQCVNKMEPHGCMTLDENAAKSLGIKDMTIEQMKCATAMFMSKPMSVTEAVALHMLGQSIIEKSPTLSCTYIATHTPNYRATIMTHMTRAGGNLSIATHAIDAYQARPSSLENVTFKDYHIHYIRRDEIHPFY